MCVPGRGTTAAYPAMSRGYYARAAAAAGQFAAARAATAATEKALWEKAQNAAARLKAADQACDQGDIRTAVRLYVRLAMSRPPNESSLAARIGWTDWPTSPHKAGRDRRDSGPRRALSRRIGRQSGRSSSDRASCRVEENGANRLREVPAAGERLRGGAEPGREVEHLRGPAASQACHRHGAQRAGGQDPVGDRPGARGCWSSVLRRYWVYRQAVQLAPAPSAIQAKAGRKSWKSAPISRLWPRPVGNAALSPSMPVPSVPCPSDPIVRQLFAEVATRRAPADSDVLPRCTTATGRRSNGASPTLCQDCLVVDTVNCRAPRLACPTVLSALLDKPAVAPNPTDKERRSTRLPLSNPSRSCFQRPGTPEPEASPAIQSRRACRRTTLPQD